MPQPAPEDTTRADGADTWPDRDRNEDGRPENARPRDRYGAPLPRGAVDEMAHKVEPEDVCTSVGQAVRAAEVLFAEQRFFEAHEFFEWAWKGPHTDEEDRTFFKGMAQLAVGYTHTQRGNATGAVSLLERGIGHIAPYGPTCHGVDVGRAIADARGFIDVIDEQGASPDRPFPGYPHA